MTCHLPRAYFWLLIAKFHYTDTDFFCGETPLGPCGSVRVHVRVRVVEFSYNGASFVRKKLGFRLVYMVGVRVRVIVAAYRPLVLRMSLILYILNAGSGRYANALVTPDIVLSLATVLATSSLSNSGDIWYQCFAEPHSVVIAWA